jgi:hypothetical protein
VTPPTRFLTLCPAVKGLLPKKKVAAAIYIYRSAAGFTVCPVPGRRRRLGGVVGETPA